jgi:uncharacterized protein
VDTGPLVAILDEREQYHETCLTTARSLHGPLLTCWPVITEAAWLLREWPHSVQRLLGSIGGRLIDLLPIAGSEVSDISAIMRKYAEIRPQLADASLVYLANREQIDTIFTLDRRDFSIYRSGRRRPFRILPEVE